MSLTFGSVRGLGSLIFSGLGFPGPSGREQGAAAPGTSQVHQPQVWKQPTKQGR